MGGYAIMAPAALGGPPGWLLWAVGGTAIIVGTVVLGREVYEATRPDDMAPPHSSCGADDGHMRFWELSASLLGTHSRAGLGY